MRKRMRDAFNENRKNVATINASLESSITGIRVTKAFTNKDKELEKFEIGNKDYVKSRSKAYKAMGGFHSSTNFVINLFNFPFDVPSSKNTKVIVSILFSSEFLNITPEAFGL